MAQVGGGAGEQPPRKEERELIKSYVNKKLVKGDTWFVLGKWWRAWMKYVKYSEVRARASCCLPIHVHLQCDSEPRKLFLPCFFVLVNFACAQRVYKLRW